MYYAMEQPLAVRAAQSERAAFIRRTYGHLAAAVLAFVAIEVVIFSVFLPTQAEANNLLRHLFVVPWSWLLVVAAFIGVGWLADYWARSDVSPGLQYLGLGLYVVAEALIFVPLLCIAVHYINDPKILPTAGILTLALFAGLTISVFVTRKDFSFLRPIIAIGSCLAFGIVLAAIIFQGFTLGIFFAFAMLALVSAAILYQTSNVIHHYRTDQHVAASLGLFASIATMFYYIVYILILSRE